MIRVEINAPTAYEARRQLRELLGDDMQAEASGACFVPAEPDAAPETVEEPKRRTRKKADPAPQSADASGPAEDTNTVQKADEPAPEPDQPVGGPVDYTTADVPDADEEAARKALTDLANRKFGDDKPPSILVARKALEYFGATKLKELDAGMYGRFVAACGDEAFVQARAAEVEG